MKFYFGSNSDISISLLVLLFSIIVIFDVASFAYQFKRLYPIKAFIKVLFPELIIPFKRIIK